MFSRIRKHIANPRTTGLCKTGLALAAIMSLGLGDAPPAPAQSVTVLYSFSGSDGAYPYTPLVEASDGNFYGTTYYGGNNGGTVYQVTPSGALTTLYAFAGTSDPNGSQPMAGLIQGTDGALYGSTEIGGAYGHGVVFKITTGGALTVLHAFTGSDGMNPLGSLIQASDGNFYGTTYDSGAHNDGTVFKLAPDGTYTVLHAFAGYPGDGAWPTAGLIQASDGNFYGVTYGGGANNAGTIFQITPAGSLMVLYSFNPVNGVDGQHPGTNLFQASDGNLYGVTFEAGTYGHGTVFQASLSGAFATIHEFSGSPDGAGPYGPFVQGSNGNLIGVTSGGGASGVGQVYQISPGGAVTDLYDFPAAYLSQPIGPRAGFIWGSDGSLYGTSYDGGSSGEGTVYKLAFASVPVLKSISPASMNAGGPAFTLIVKGSGFANSSVVNWNGSPLTTTYVSATELKAAVPASLIASPGATHVTVVTSGSGASSAKTFSILVTTLKLASGSLTKNSDGSYTATISLKNSGYLAAQNVKITKASLGLAGTSTTLPVSMGNIAAGSNGSASLSFPGSAGSSGTSVFLKVSATFTGGKVSGSLRVTLP
ncbi:MAG TPA: choice-of-anchor tandem repeat GloVer-containing protein [Chthonomonadaceae bacterium]|nr:choice-of-anchor tandem repeat GloVer-containing protein [Chthonomonadaceae bacterium]